MFALLRLSFLFLLLFPFALLARISNPLVNGVGAGRCVGFSFSFLIVEGKLSLLHYEEWCLVSGFFFFPLGLYHMARGILVPQPEIEPSPPSVEAWSLNGWTTREVLSCRQDFYKKNTLIKKTPFMVFNECLLLIDVDCYSWMLIFTKCFFCLLAFVFLWLGKGAATLWR